MAAPVSPARKALQAKSNIYVLIAVALQLIYMYLVSAAKRPGQFDPILALCGLGVGVVSLVFWVIAVSYYAQSKGYSKWWGAAGLLSCCGVLILIFFPNRWVDAPVNEYQAGDYPRPR